MLKFQRLSQTKVLAKGCRTGATVNSGGRSHEDMFNLIAIGRSFPSANRKIVQRRTAEMRKCIGFGAPPTGLDHMLVIADLQEHRALVSAKSSIWLRFSIAPEVHCQSWAAFRSVKECTEAWLSLRPNLGPGCERVRS